MACTTTWLLLVLFLALIFIIFATIIAFVAPSYIVSNSTTSSTAAANNSTAVSMLYGAGAVGVIVLILLIVGVYLSWVTVDETGVVKLETYYFGVGTLILSLIIFLGVILMLFLTIYAVSLIDPNVNTNSTARWWAIAAASFAGVALILIFISWFLFYGFNNCITELINAKVKVGDVKIGDVKREAKSFDIGPFDAVRNYVRVPGDFVGELTLKGEVRKQPQKIIINGVERVNEAGGKTDLINYKYNVSDQGVVKLENRVVEDKGVVKNNQFDQLRKDALKRKFQQQQFQ